jgi:gliding motility-associated-like protein
MNKILLISAITAFFFGCSQEEPEQDGQDGSLYVMRFEHEKTILYHEEEDLENVLTWELTSEEFDSISQFLGNKYREKWSEEKIRDWYVEHERKHGGDVSNGDVRSANASDSSKVTIYADMKRKTRGDKIVVKSSVSNIEIPRYTWLINNLMMLGEERAELASNLFRQGDKIQLGVNNEFRREQPMVMSNVLTISYSSTYYRDTLVNIIKGGMVSELNMFKPGDEGNEFFVEQGGYTGSGRVYIGINTGKFTYIPDADFTGMDKVTYIIRDRSTGERDTGYIYIQVSGTGKYEIPNVITPNGDGMNDKWVLNFLEEYPDHMVTVYDWQDRCVFRARNYQHDWDGIVREGGYYRYYMDTLDPIIDFYTYEIDLGNREKRTGMLEIAQRRPPGFYAYGYRTRVDYEYQVAPDWFSRPGHRVLKERDGNTVTYLIK